MDRVGEHSGGGLSLSHGVWGVSWEIWARLTQSLGAETAGAEESLLK